MGVWPLGQEDPMEKEMAPPLQYSCLENPMDRGAWRELCYIVCAWLCWVCIVVLSAPEHLGSEVAVRGLSCSAACGILVPWPGIKPTSPALQAGFLTTGPPRKPSHFTLCPLVHIFYFINLLWVVFVSRYHNWYSWLYSYQSYFIPVLNFTFYYFFSSPHPFFFSFSLSQTSSSSWTDRSHMRKLGRLVTVENQISGLEDQWLKHLTQQEKNGHRISTVLSCLSVGNMPVLPTFACILKISEFIHSFPGWTC